MVTKKIHVPIRCTEIRIITRAEETMVDRVAEAWATVSAAEETKAMAAMSGALQIMVHVVDGTQVAAEDLKEAAEADMVMKIIGRRIVHPATEAVCHAMVTLAETLNMEINMRTRIIPTGEIM